MGDLEIGEKIGDIEARISFIEKKDYSHLCTQVQRLCDIEMTQKMTVESIRKMSDRQEKIDQNIILYREEIIKDRKTTFWACIVLVITLISMSVGYYIKTHETMNTGFSIITKDINTIKIQLGIK
jgi:hypothetical protein